MQISEIFSWIAKEFLNASGSCDLLGRPQYQSIFEQKYLKNGKSSTFLKEHLISFLMIRRLIDCGLVVLWLLMLKV